MDRHITKEQHDELIQIMNELIDVLKAMNTTYFIHKNLREANDWLNFLVAHTDVEELESLHKEIVERFVFAYDQSEEFSKIDRKRIALMQTLMGKFHLFLSETE